MIKALKKKLRAIDDLIQKEKAGLVLDSQQQEKVGRLGEVMEQMKHALASIDVDIDV